MIKWNWYDKNPAGYAHGSFIAKDKNEVIEKALDEIGLASGQTVYFWRNDKGTPYYAENTIKVTPVISKSEDVDFLFNHYNKSHRDFIDFAKKHSGVTFADNEISRFKSGEVSLSKGVIVALTEFFSSIA